MRVTPLFKYGARYSRMDGLELAILAAVVVALLLFVAYFAAARREKGLDPFYAREVYLLLPGSEGSPAFPGAPPGLAAAEHAAARLGAEVATAGQVAVYAASGGRALGCGLVAEGRAVQLLPGGAVAGCGPAALGVWLYGPKPRRLYPGVAPFDGAHWFQLQ